MTSAAIVRLKAAAPQDFSTAVFFIKYFHMVLLDMPRKKRNQFLEIFDELFDVLDDTGETCISRK